MMCRGLVVIPKAAVERRSVTLPKNTLYTSKAARRDGGVQLPSPAWIGDTKND